MTKPTQPRYTLWDAVGATVTLGVRLGERFEKLAAEVRNLARQPGPQGERGPEGPPGKLTSVRAWSDVVHYEGDIVHLNGSTWQAKTDTAKEPPHDDWALIASKGTDGKDAREWTVRGLYQSDENYRALDVVALNGGSFIAVKDDPGAIPGEGWRQLCQRGKAGPPGPPGEKGDRGAEGKRGASLIDVTVKDFDLILTMSDGDVTVVSLRPLFERCHEEVAR
jgi:hypothetical protein